MIYSNTFLTLLPRPVTIVNQMFQKKQEKFIKNPYCLLSTSSIWSANN